MENLNLINTLIGATIPLVIVYLGIRLERQRNRIERKHEYRMQFDLECKVLGPQAGHYILDISAILHNKGLVRLVIDSLRLKIRGIEQEQNIELFEEYSDEGAKNLIAEFPAELVNANMLQALKIENESKNINSENQMEKGYFVEPGVEQRFSYIARIPERISFVLIRAQFEYDRKQNSKRLSEHTAQIVLQINTEDPKHQC